jgi:hypothetical protein
MEPLALIGFVLALLAFVVAQGAAIFSTAFVALRMLRLRHWLANAPAMCVSYIAWIAFTIAGYSYTGGDGSFMKGFTVVILLCCTAAISSFLYLIAWLLAPILARSLRRAPVPRSALP